MTDEVKEAFEKTWKVALYQSLRHGWVHEQGFYGDDDKDYHDGYVRISEIADVRFRPLAHDDVIQNAVAAFDAAERDARNECNKKIAEIRQAKATLLALTHDQSDAA